MRLSNVKIISIPNWEEYQHYKDKNFITWIKLYTKLLTSYKIAQLTAEERWCYIALLLLAPLKNNKIVQDFTYFLHFFAVSDRECVKKIIKKMIKVGLIEAKSVKDSIKSIDPVYNPSIPNREDKIREDKIRKEKKKLLNKLKMPL